MLTLGHALDPASLNPAGRPATLDPAELTRHAVCVGMTGSGKTGLCVGLLESLALQGVPVLALDPKGDLANLALALDPANPAEFEPWVDPAEAARQGRSVAEHAAATARAWGEAQARDGLTPDALQARRSGVEVVVHTPGSTAGVPVDVFTALTRAPEGLDPEGLAEYVTGAVSALLSLVGLAGDPLTDPRAILLARVLGDAFARGEAAPFDVLLPRLVDPPFETLGYFSVDEVLPREERTALALALNNVAASPAFRAWLTGVPLDVGAWLQPGPSGKTPLRVLSLAHLDDRQRSFFVTMVLHAVVAWTRRLPGTGALRALVYFDEVMGYLPPHPKDPPTKAPVLTLLKQARAVGVGVVLCTQNPVDVDYKALSNAGTWFVGRLQTQQDRRRVVDGLVAASGGADPAAVDELLGRLPRRAFVWRTADSPAAQVLRTRQVLCFLRGPLTRAEIGSLGQSWTGRRRPRTGCSGSRRPCPRTCRCGGWRRRRTGRWGSCPRGCGSRRCTCGSGWCWTCRGSGRSGWCTGGGGRTRSRRRRRCRTPGCCGASRTAGAGTRRRRRPWWGRGCGGSGGRRCCCRSRRRGRTGRWSGRTGRTSRWWAGPSCGPPRPRRRQRRSPPRRSLRGVADGGEHGVDHPLRHGAPAGVQQRGRRPTGVAGRRPGRVGGHRPRGASGTRSSGAAGCRTGAGGRSRCCATGSASRASAPPRPPRTCRGRRRSGRSRPGSGRTTARSRGTSSGIACARCGRRRASPRARRRSRCSRTRGGRRW
jgi:hypothetical protein